MELTRHTLSFWTYLIDPSSTGINVITSLGPGTTAGPPYPADGLNVLYGRPSQLEELSAIMESAKTKGQKVVPVEIVLEAWRPKAAPHWFDDMANKTVFDLRRLSKKLKVENLIISYFSDYLKADGVLPQDIKSRPHSAKSDFALYPHYLDRLKAEAVFKHIDAFIWQTEEQGKQVVRGTIYNTNCVTRIQPLDPNIRAKLP